jgi:hypothetical protein
MFVLTADLDDRRGVESVSARDQVIATAAERVQIAAPVDFVGRENRFERQKKRVPVSVLTPLIWESLVVASIRFTRPKSSTLATSGSGRVRRG